MEGGKKLRKTCSQMETYLDEGSYGDLFEYEVFETMRQRMAEVLKETLPLTEEEISELDGMTSARISKLLREGYGLEGKKT